MVSGIDGDLAQLQSNRDESAVSPWPERHYLEASGDDLALFAISASTRGEDDCRLSGLRGHDTSR